jgi:hypothetical protein
MSKLVQLLYFISEGVTQKVKVFLIKVLKLQIKALQMLLHVSNGFVVPVMFKQLESEES